MRKHLISYVNLLFAGAPDMADLKSQIMDIALNRFDSLVDAGSTPESAYTQVISEVGDVDRLIAGVRNPASIRRPMTRIQRIRRMRSWAIGLFIASPLPLFLLHQSWCLWLVPVPAIAAAIILLVFGLEKGSIPAPLTALQKTRNILFVSVLALEASVYLLLSFLMDAWHVTWVLFPLTGTLTGLCNACMDLEEVRRHES